MLRRGLYPRWPCKARSRRSFFNFKTYGHLLTHHWLLIYLFKLVSSYHVIQLYSYTVIPFTIITSISCSLWSYGHNLWSLRSVHNIFQGYAVRLAHWLKGVAPNRGGITRSGAGGGWRGGMRGGGVSTTLYPQAKTRAGSSESSLPLFWLRSDSPGLRSTICCRCFGFEALPKC